MRRLRPSSEAEMIALFLRTELPSDRWRDDLRARLKRALRLIPRPPELEDLDDCYRKLHRAKGNDQSVGLRLGDPLTSVGLIVERYACRAPVFRLPPGMRPPSWAARDEMVAAGFASDTDIQRWEQAFARRPTLVGGHGSGGRLCNLYEFRALPAWTRLLIPGWR